MIKFTQDDIFLVTGASSGLGESVALALNNLGAKVIAVSRTQANLEKTKQKASNQENFFVESFDFKQTSEINGFIKSLAKKYGKFNGVAHFAGMSILYPLRAVSTEKLKEIFELNVYSSYEVVKAFNDKRVKSAQMNSIVLVSSISSMRSFEGLSAYGTTKGAINSLVISSALELAKNSVRINAVVPGHIETTMTQQLAQLQSDEYREEIKNSYPLGSGEPQDVSNLTIFLLSNASKWITGQNIVIDGGRTQL